MHDENASQGVGTENTPHPEGEKFLDFMAIQYEHFKQGLIHPEAQKGLEYVFWGHDLLEHFALSAAIRTAPDVHPMLKAHANAICQGPGIGEELPSGLFEVLIGGLDFKPEYVNKSRDEVIKALAQGIRMSLDPGHTDIGRIFPIGQIDPEEVTSVVSQDYGTLRGSMSTSEADPISFHKRRYAYLGLDRDFDYVQEILDNAERIAECLVDILTELHTILKDRLAQYVSEQLPKQLEGLADYELTLREIGTGVIPLQKQLVSWYMERELLQSLFEVTKALHGFVRDINGKDYYVYDNPDLLELEDHLRSFFAQTPLPQSLACVMHSPDYYLNKD